jgi:hypothetical protein
MISGVTSPSTLAALQSRQKTDPTVSISQTKPFPDHGTNEGTNGPTTQASAQQSPPPDRVTLSREGLEAAAFMQNEPHGGAGETGKSPKTSEVPPPRDTTANPTVQSSVDEAQDRTADYAKLQQKSILVQQQNAPTLGVANVGSLLNMVA